MDLTNYKVVDYVIIDRKELDSLSNAVKEKIREGYIPLGGISLNEYMAGAQAMIRLEPK